MLVWCVARDGLDCICDYGQKGALKYNVLVACQSVWYVFPVSCACVAQTVSSECGGVLGRTVVEQCASYICRALRCVLLFRIAKLDTLFMVFLLSPLLGTLLTSSGMLPVEVFNVLAAFTRPRVSA